MADKLPKWFDPGKVLLAFVDGPRAGEWAYEDYWANEVRLAQPPHNTGRAPDRTLDYTRSNEPDVIHPQDERIAGKVMRWKS